MQEREEEEGVSVHHSFSEQSRTKTGRKAFLKVREQNQMSLVCTAICRLVAFTQIPELEMNLSIIGLCCNTF